jgi:hypothetical protein
MSDKGTGLTSEYISNKSVSQHNKQSKENASIQDIDEKSDEKWEGSAFSHMIKEEEVNLITDDQKTFRLARWTWFKRQLIQGAIRVGILEALH